MAHSTSSFRAALTHFSKTLRQTFGHLLNSAAHAAEAQTLGDARLEQVRVLQSKTDAQLAQMGLARRDITTRVFRDYYGLRAL